MLEDDAPSSSKRPARKDDKGGRKGREDFGGWATLESASKVELVADFRCVRGGEKGGVEGEGERAKCVMPEGAQLMGAESTFVQQEDGSQVGEGMEERRGKGPGEWSAGMGKTRKGGRGGKE
ncbi:MAG: hypothetical protein SGPRY_000158 [Prymnesium sp.]